MLFVSVSVCVVCVCVCVCACVTVLAVLAVTARAAADTPTGPFARSTGLPLKRVQFRWRTETPVPKADLQRRARVFWDTCAASGGDAQVWHALRSVCVDFGDADIAMCRQLLQACDVVLPLGLLTEIYDARGFRYVLPPYCVCDPVNVQGVSVGVGVGVGGMSVGAGANGTIGADGTTAADGTTGADGSTAADGPNHGTNALSVLTRLSTGVDVALQVPPDATVADLKRLLEQPAAVPVARMFVFLRGQLLADAAVLRGLGLTSRTVVQVMIK